MGHGKDVQHTLRLILSTEHHSAMGFMTDSRSVNQKLSWVFRDRLLSAPCLAEDGQTFSLVLTNSQS